MAYNSLKHIFTTMIGFVTWPPFCTITTGSIKLTMAGTYVEMVVPISSILGLLILYSKNVVGL